MHISSIPPAVDPAVETEYNNRARIPDHAAIFARWAQASAEVRREAKGDYALRYGNHPRQTLDIFTHAGTQRHRLLIFIHGGYWRSLSKDEFSWIAPPFLAAAIDVAVVNYRLCPAVGISDILDDCELAIERLLADPRLAGTSELVLAGHSAGGHLVACLLSRWQAKARHVQLRAGLALSGVFDLLPLLETSMNADLKLDGATAATLSPLSWPQPATPLPTFVGALESDAFRAQSHGLAAAWPQAVGQALEIPNAHHFSILDDFANPQGLAGHAVVSAFCR
jgi:arylformamidase